VHPQRTKGIWPNPLPFRGCWACVASPRSCEHLPACLQPPGSGRMEDDRGGFAPTTPRCRSEGALPGCGTAGGGGAKAHAGTARRHRNANEGVAEALRFNRSSDVVAEALRCNENAKGVPTQAAKGQKIRVVRPGSALNQHHCLWAKQQREPRAGMQADKAWAHSQLCRLLMSWHVKIGVPSGVGRVATYSVWVGSVAAAASPRARSGRI
jgi:hypothetical protein